MTLDCMNRGDGMTCGRDKYRKSQKMGQSLALKLE